MRVKNDTWTADQYAALAASLVPGVTLEDMVKATKSNARDVLFRLRSFQLAAPLEADARADGCCGYRWVAIVSTWKFRVIDADGNLIIDVWPIIESHSWKKTEENKNKLINGLYRRDRVDNQIRY